jgi:hypothetical protein
LKVAKRWGRLETQLQAALAFAVIAARRYHCRPMPLIHENLRQSIEDLSARMIAIRDSL